MTDKYARTVVLNAFSMQMLISDTTLKFQRIPAVMAEVVLDEALGEIQSFVGHEDFAYLVSQELHHSIPFNRGFYKFDPKDIILVAQLVGGRLPEGCKNIPEGMSIKYWLVKPIEEEPSEYVKEFNFKGKTYHAHLEKFSGDPEIFCGIYCENEQVYSMAYLVDFSEKELNHQIDNFIESL